MTPAVGGMSDNGRSTQEAANAPAEDGRLHSILDAALIRQLTDTPSADQNWARSHKESASSQPAAS